MLLLIFLFILSNDGLFDLNIAFIFCRYLYFRSLSLLSLLISRLVSHHALTPSVPSFQCPTRLTDPWMLTTTVEHHPLPTTRLQLHLHPLLFPASSSLEEELVDCCLQLSLSRSAFHTLSLNAAPKSSLLVKWIYYLEEKIQHPIEMLITMCPSTNSDFSCSALLTSHLPQVPLCALIPEFCLCSSS